MLRHRQARQELGALGALVLIAALPMWSGPLQSVARDGQGPLRAAVLSLPGLCAACRGNCHWQARTARGITPGADRPGAAAHSSPGHVAGRAASFGCSRFGAMSVPGLRTASPAAVVSKPAGTGGKGPIASSSVAAVLCLRRDTAICSGGRCADSR